MLAWLLLFLLLSGIVGCNSTASITVVDSTIWVQCVEARRIALRERRLLERWDVPQSCTAASDGALLMRGFLFL